MFQLAAKFVKAVVPGVVRPMHALWNEILGFLFLSIALLLVRSIWRAWQTLDADPANWIKFLLTVFFFLVLLFFGVQGFWKARRISRS